MSVEEMSPPFLTAEKNVREKLKKINQVIDRADGLYHQKAASGRDVSIHDDEDNNNNFNNRGTVGNGADSSNASLTKLLSQPMKMKDGTIGAPIFVLATCAAEGLDSHTVRDVFERLIRYGAWRVALDEHGTYPRVAKTISPVALLCSVYAPHVLKQAVVDNVDHDKKYDSLDGKTVVAVSTVKEENHEEAKVHKHTLQNLNKVLEMFVDAGANVDETYQIDPSVSSIYTPSLSSRDGGSPTSSASASPKKDTEDSTESLSSSNHQYQQYASYKFPSCAMHSGTIGNCLFFLSIAISFGSDIQETIEALHIITQRGSNKQCDLNVKCYVPDRPFDFEYDETKSFLDLERRVCPRTPAGDYISSLQFLVMSLVENAAFSVEIRDGIASFCVRLIDLGSVLGIDVNNECSFYAQNDLSRFEISNKRLAFDFIESKEELARGSAGNACNALQPKGSPLFFTGIALLEGCGTPALRLAKKLLEKGANPNCFGDYPMIGSNTPLVALALYCSLNPSGWDEQHCIHYVEKPWWTLYYEAPKPTHHESRRSSAIPNNSYNANNSADDTRGHIRKNDSHDYDGDAQVMISDLRDQRTSYKDTRQRERNDQEEGNVMHHQQQNSSPTSSLNGTNDRYGIDAISTFDYAASAFVDRMHDFFREPKRGERALKHSSELFKLLLDYGASPSTEWQRVPRLHIDDIEKREHRVSTLLSIAIEDMLNFVEHGKGTVELLIKKGADINKCGLGPFPVFCSPLFAASAALRYGHPDADWLFETIIKSSASANALGYFPGGSQSTAMIELIRCVGESKSKVRRENVFSKIESLLKMGADANQSCLDCFLNTTPTAYTDIIQYRAGLTPDVTPLDTPFDTPNSINRIDNSAFSKTCVEDDDDDDDDDDDEGYSSNGYTRFYDPYHEMYYYVDEATGASDWMKPDVFVDPKERKIRPPLQPPHDSDDNDPEQHGVPYMDELSEDYDEDSYDQGYKSNDWVRWYDATYARYYYFNEKTYEVQWAKPEDFNELDVAKVTKSPLAARAVSDADVARSLREKMDLEVKGKENATKIDHKAAEAKEKKKSADSDASVETKRVSLHSLRVDAGKLADTRNSENVSTEESDGKKGAVRTSVSSNKFKSAFNKQQRDEISFDTKASEPLVSDTADVLPKTIDRTGECTFSPLFVAMDCLEGDGHQVAARIILLLLDFGADIEYEQERNLRSWYEGSIIAIAIQIAISCGSPIELTHPSVGDGDGDGDGKNDGNSNKENFRGHRVKERQQEPDNDSFDGNKEFTRGIIQLEQHIPTLETISATEASAQGHGGVSDGYGNNNDSDSDFDSREIASDSVQQNDGVKVAMDIARVGKLRRKQLGMTEDTPRHDSYDRLKSLRGDAETIPDTKEARTTVVAQTVYESSKFRYDAADLHLVQAEIARERLRLRYPQDEENQVPEEKKSFWKTVAKAIGFEDSDDEGDDGEDTLMVGMFFDTVFGFDDGFEKQYKLNTFEEDHARASLARIHYGIDDRGSLKSSRIKMEQFRKARFESATKVAKALIARSSARVLNRLCRNPLLEEYGTDLVPFEFTPFFAACFGAATAESDEQVKLGIELARDILAKGADCTVVGRHAKDKPSEAKVADYAKSIEARTAPFVWAVTASARCPKPEFGGLKLVKDCLAKGANPLLCELETTRYPEGRGMTISNNPSKLLNLWDDKSFLENMPPKQRREAEASRIELGRLLGEASTVRSVFTKSNALAKKSMDAIIADAKKECSLNGRWGMKGEKNHGVTRRNDNDEIEDIATIEQSARKTTQALMQALSRDDLTSEEVAVASDEENIMKLSEDLSKLNASLNITANQTRSTTMTVPGMSRAVEDAKFESGQKDKFVMGDIMKPVLGAPKRFAQVAVLARESSLRNRTGRKNNSKTTLKAPMFSAMSSSFVKKDGLRYSSSPSFLGSFRRKKESSAKNEKTVSFK